jgi:hypothetical protein
MFIVYPMTNSEQLDAFIGVCQSLPGFKKEEYGSVEENLLSGVYSYDPVDRILVIQDGWRIKIENDGKFIPLEES